jgi:hypothetical protein
MKTLLTALLCVVVVVLVVTLSGTFTINAVHAQSACSNCTRKFFCCFVLSVENGFVFAEMFGNYLVSMNEPSQF